jgi:hypothetical protein
VGKGKRKQGLGRSGMKRVYENDKIRVFWDSDKCFHAANCTRDLPEVFDVNLTLTLKFKYFTDEQ